MLRRADSERKRAQRLAVPAGVPGGVSRRDFLRRSGLTTGTLALAGTIQPAFVRRAKAQAAPTGGGFELKKTVCPFCAVGCSIWAEVKNGVWIGQEPTFESPINMGTHCAKGAATRELVIGERRLKYPTKLVNGKWERISWDQAINEIGDKLLQIREQSGPDSAYWLGSAKFSNEQAYLMRKFAAFWGSNNVDHQARICHSTTVAGVANVFGYGAMTNSFNDIQNSRSIFLIGGNPAEAHPVSMLHLLKAKEDGAKLIVIDPRFTRTARHANEYVRLRTGTDVAFMYGVLWHIFENGWEDKDFIKSRVYGMDAVRKEVKKWNPVETERVTGVPGEQVLRVARTMAENRPGTLIWCMGLTQSHIGNNKTRAATLVQMALGNMGVPGGGTNIFRGHDNVQGATDLGLLCHDLPGYYGLAEGAWRHWARVWDVDYEWLKGRFASKELMEQKGIPVSRWFDGVIENKENVDQPNKIRAMVYWGHAPNSQTRLPDLKKGMEQLDLMVVIDPVPTLSAVLSERRDGVFLLPAASTMECAGSVTNSQRALQWREKVVDPVFESKTDYEITHLLARKLGFVDQLFKHISMEGNQPLAEDITREFNQGMWTVGYSGQSPERLKLHMQHQDKFDTRTSLGMSAPVEGEYYGMPWPCWGTADIRHPGTPILYDESKSVAKGGLPFRARWGVEHNGTTLLAEGTYTKGSAIQDGYPEMTVAVLEKLGYVSQLSAREKVIIAAIAIDGYDPSLSKITEERARQLLGQMEAAEGGAITSNPQIPSASNSNQFPNISTRAREAIRAYVAEGPQGAKSGMHARQDKDLGEAEFGSPGAGRDQQPIRDGKNPRDKVLKVNWKTDLSGGIQRVAIANGLAPFGNGKARALVWNFPDAVPVHREPLHTPRRDLVKDYPTYNDRRDYRLPVLYRSIQEHDFTREFPMILTTGRLVEYEGGGDETRANKWLAELQQEMFVEINPHDARSKGVRDKDLVWIHSPSGGRIKVVAMVTERVGPGTVFLPFHFGGYWMGESIADRYPEGAAPWVVGESANTAGTYGYDVVTFMQEAKGTLCRVERA
ncbi:formate dehydrogenase subunit alpha [Bradyrhizobium icense]|uniref:formate dehydrogenase subunit alpha n=1 Tax=Bradyrhizobium icense TaxID=1274631 RepID=UPI0009F165E3|nr:formate dehydrogenase subunit alpha [Bradyrhizobium icense]